MSSSAVSAPSFFRFRWAFVGVAKLWLRDQHLLAYVIEVLFVNAKRGAVAVGVGFVFLQKVEELKLMPAPAVVKANADSQQANWFFIPSKPFRK